MRKNLTKKLFLSILTLAFAVVSLGASTYAWFTMSKDATIEPFDGTVTAGTSGLEIQITEIGGTVEDNGWSATSVSGDTIKGLLDAQFKFEAVQFNKDTYNFIGQDAALSLKGADDTAATKAELNKGYIGFNVHFRLADAAAATGTVALYLQELNLNHSEDAGGWNAAKAYKEYVNETTTKDIAQGPVEDPYFVTDAARVALKNNSDSSYNKIYEAKKAEGSTHFTSNFNNYGAIDYYNQVNEYVGENADKAITAPVSGHKGYYNATQFSAAEQVGVLQNTANQYITITVYIWIDGWDAECINDIFAQTLTVDMKFTIEQPTA